MFNKKNVKLDEAIMGMTPMFDLARMQELAGIQNVGQSTAMTPPVQVEMPDATEESDSHQQVMCALDTLAAALPGVTISELKDIRARFNEIFTIMNEGLEPRKLKL